MRMRRSFRHWKSLALLALCLLLPLGFSACRQSAAQGEPETVIQKPEAPDPLPEPTGPKDPEGDIKIKDPGPGGLTT